MPAFIKSADGETTSMPTVTFTAPENGNFWAIAVSGAVTPSNVMTYFDITATPTLVKTSGRLGVVEPEAKGVQTITTAHFGNAVKGTTYTFTVVLGGGSLLAPRPMNLTVFWSPNQ